MLGYEVEGLENIPDRGPAMIIYYHGCVPVDFYYIMATCFLEKGRLIHAIGDKFLFSIPGLCLPSPSYLKLVNLTLNCISSVVHLMFTINASFPFAIILQPGWRKLMEVFKTSPGTVSSCVENLRNGNIIGIAPGRNQNIIGIALGWNEHNLIIE